ncbi:hypothetical protein ABIB40_004213, partial [Pedobacter sp. UYP30]
SKSDMVKKLVLKPEPNWCTMPRNVVYFVRNNQSV